MDKVREAPPDFFERPVVEQLVAMGYGGSRADAGQAIGQSGTRASTGSSRRTGSASTRSTSRPSGGPPPSADPRSRSSPEHCKDTARKGVFITTSEFSREAEDYVSRIDSKIVLIDGRKLAGLMFEHDVGVTRVGTYELKRIDGDYFEGA